MSNKYNTVLCLTFVLALLLNGCAQMPPSVVHEKLDAKSLNLITSTDVVLITRQNHIDAQVNPDTYAVNSGVAMATPYAPPNGAGLIGLFLGTVIATDISLHDQTAPLIKPLKRINDSMQGYAINENFSEKLTTNLHKLKWLNSDKTNIVKSGSRKHMLHSIISESNSPLVMVVRISYSFNQKLSEYWIDAVATLYPKSKYLQHIAMSGTDTVKYGHQILYRNYFHYVQTLKGNNTLPAAANIWSNMAGAHYIRNVTESGLDTLAKLITYDLSLYPYNLKDRDIKTPESASDGANTIKGTLIAENNYMVSLRTKDGSIYCLPRNN